jgi:recombination protein RecT
MVAPRHLTPDRITRIAMTSIQHTPKLLDCTPESLLGSVLTCTQLGLEPDGVSGRAYLIPYKDKCTLIVGYKGLMELARRSGEVQALEARVVHENDEFDYAYGDNPFIKHKPSLFTEPGKMIAAYAVATMKGGLRQLEVMSKKDIDGIRARSKAKKDGPWVTDYDEMAKKTVIRRLCKYLPSSAELSQAIALDEQAERGIPQNVAVIDVPTAPSTPKGNGKNKLDAMVDADDAKPVGDAVEAAIEHSKEDEKTRTCNVMRKKAKAEFIGLELADQNAVLKQCGLNKLDDIDGWTEPEGLKSLCDAIADAKKAATAK